MSAEQLLQEGISLLESKRLEQATDLLMQARQHPETRLRAHNLIETHALSGCFLDMMGIDCRISQEDDIFHFFAGHPTSTNPLRDYLADGWRTLSELMWLLETVDRPLIHTKNFLEFASGHGRFTRHLVKALGASRVHVSDVVTDAVTYAQNTFGVPGFVSTTQPQQLTYPQSYELVFVLSLFTHLPQSSWSQWLRKLYDALEPDGLLIITTHGQQAQRLQKVEMNESGFRFFASSESNAIDAQEYGTTFTSDAFVRNEIAQHIGSDALIHFAPTCFWNYQDAYVIRKSAQPTR